MQTNFSAAQLAAPDTADAERVIRKCVHCGFCTATCPTYVLLGDELDSPRGRIYLMKEMLEQEKTPSAEVVKHIDRCLSCLACKTTCPSGVDYMKLVDHARAYVEHRYRRPFMDRALRDVLAWTLPVPGRFRWALRLGRLARPFAGALARLPQGERLAAMLDLVPAAAPAPFAPQLASGAGEKGRVLMLGGCAEPVLRPEIGAATRRLLARIGYRVDQAGDEGCCGALVHHLGKEEAALAAARRNVDAWTRAEADGAMKAILITASGCGTTVKNYGYMLRNDPAYADRAARYAAMTKDVSEFLAGETLPPSVRAGGLKVAYHAACSLQHGQKVTEPPKRLLAQAGFTVAVPAEAHLCCGSAGTYNILQPKIAAQLGARKVGHLERLGADVIATGNIGCATQIGRLANIPVVHTIELLDFATGGPAPAALAAILDERTVS